MEQKIVSKISEAPTLWMFLIVAFFGLFGTLGIAAINSAYSQGISLLGFAMILISIAGVYATSKFYMKHDLLNDTSNCSE